MSYVIVELVICIAWISVVASRIRKGSRGAVEELTLIMFAMPAAALMEYRNQFLQAGTGVYYPRSLFYFPGSHFPLAIVLSSSLFAWLLLVISREIAGWILGDETRFRVPVIVGLFLVLISTNFVTEWLGVYVGYWGWHITPPSTFRVWMSKYLFYFWFSFPPLFATIAISWLGKRAVANEDSGPPALFLGQS